MNIPGSTSKSTNVLDLKNPYFRYGGQVVASVPQDNSASPTEQYYTANGYQTNMVNTKATPAHDQQVQNLANFTAVNISGGKKCLLDLFFGFLFSYWLSVWDYMQCTCVCTCTDNGPGLPTFRLWSEISDFLLKLQTFLLLFYMCLNLKPRLFCVSHRKTTSKHPRIQEF